MSNIVKVDAAEFGIEEQRAKQIRDAFKPMLEKMVELEKEANEVFKLPAESPESATQAKEVRLKYVKVRTGTAKIHTEQKAFYLAAGRFVDGWKNAQIFASQGIEGRLKEIEDHAENKERERIEGVRVDRWGKLSQYMEVEPQGLAQMDDDTFSMLFNGAKSSHDAKIEAEKKAEAERIAKEKAEAEERERQRQENIRLKAEAEAREKEIASERKKQAEKEAAERAERQRIQAEAEAKLKAEREAREKVEAEIKARQDAEEKSRKKAEAEAKKAAKAPVKIKMKNAINSLEMPILESLKDEEADTWSEILAKHESFKKWALNQIETL